EGKADLVDREDALTALAALGEGARPELVPCLVDHIKCRAIGVEHERGGEGDPQEDLFDVRLERELALELEQRFELLGLAQRCHSPRILAQSLAYGEGPHLPRQWSRVAHL